MAGTTTAMRTVASSPVCLPHCLPTSPSHVIKHAPFKSPTQPNFRSYPTQRLVICQAKGFGAAPAAKTLSKQAACPCGSGATYKECCRRYHDGELPPTAEALMRSRYSAYSKGLVQYVVDTTHPENPLAAGSNNADGTPSSSKQFFF